MSEVKVYIYGAELECPYDYEWMDQPYSPVGDMLRFSEARSHMIPREMYDKWCRARDLFNEVQDDMEQIVRRDNKPL